MSEYKQYRRSQIAELADWTPGFDMQGVSISDADKAAGSPKAGDKIARNPANHADRWLVAADYFAVNFEPVAALRAQREPVVIPGWREAEAKVVAGYAEPLDVFIYHNEPVGSTAEMLFREQLQEVIKQFATPPTRYVTPVDMVLYCPKCGTQHIDAPDHPYYGGMSDDTGFHPRWDNPPHKSHLCCKEDGGCGHIWRPSDTPTNGVKATVSGKDADTKPVGGVSFEKAIGICDEVMLCPEDVEYDNRLAEQILPGDHFNCACAAIKKKILNCMENPPDKNCITTADGGCVGGLMAGKERCMHDVEKKP